jgi:endonuclease-3 related protein
VGLWPEEDTYDAWRVFFMKNLPLDGKLFNEYHALLVRHGKETCRKHPVCDNCCLVDICRARR